MNKNSNYALLLLLATALLLTTAFQNPKPGDGLYSGILKKNMDTSITPGNNFTQYVNGSWFKNTMIPDDRATYGAMSILYDKAQDDVQTIIENAAKGNPKEGSEEQKIGDYYAAFMNKKIRDAIGIKPLQEEFKKIDAIASPKDLAAYFSYANKIGNMIPLNIGIIEDFKDPKKYMIYTWQSGLGLPDREYYFMKDSKSVALRAKYLIHIQNMLKLAGLTDPKTKASQIMALETSIAAKHMKKEATRNMPGLYNKYAVSSLKALTPALDWNTLLREAGIKNLDSLVVTQVAFTKDLNAILKNTPLSTWKTYLKWSATTAAANSLNSALEDEDFDFRGKALYGIKEQKEQWRKAVNAVNENLGEVVGKVYVEKHFPVAAKVRMELLVNNLLKAYEVSIKDLDWMSPDTKKQALDKLNKFRPKIGYPDKWRDYSTLKVVKNDLYGNNDEALRNTVSTDPHSPAQFRVNGVVRNIPEFYTAFNVKPTDSLYLSPEKRVKIW